jgi:hypothetical protein
VWTTRNRLPQAAAFTGRKTTVVLV